MIFMLAVFSLPLLNAEKPCEDIPNKYAENLQSILASMPIEDRQDLDCLFRLLMVDGDFAYALFGDKPVAFFDFFMDFEKCGFFIGPSAFNSFSIVNRGLHVWEKYKSMFLSNSFNLMAYVTPDHDVVGFVLYHRQRVKTLYDTHHPLMKNVFGSVDRIAPLICGPVIDKLKFVRDENLYHEAIGLLLGYDETSSRRFREKFDLSDALAIGPFALEGLNSRSVDAVLQRLEKKIAHLDCSNSKKFNLVDTIERLNTPSGVVSLTLRDETLSPMRIPRYGAIEGAPEVIARQKAYDEVRGRIVEILFSENFLEIILSRLQS